MIIDREILDCYERYLIRNMSVKKEFVEYLDQYFEFIGCLDMEPFCRHASDESIMNVSNDSDDSDCDSLDSIGLLGFDYLKPHKLHEEFYPRYQTIVNGLTKEQIDTTMEKVRVILEEESNSSPQKLTKRMTKLFEMDVDFKDILFTI